VLGSGAIGPFRGCGEMTIRASWYLHDMRNCIQCYNGWDPYITHLFVFHRLSNFFLPYLRKVLDRLPGTQAQELERHLIVHVRRRLTRRGVMCPGIYGFELRLAIRGGIVNEFQ